MILNETVWEFMRLYGTIRDCMGLKGLYGTEGTVWDRKGVYGTVRDGTIKRLYGT